MKKLIEKLGGHKALTVIALVAVVALVIVMAVSGVDSSGGHGHAH